MSIINFPIKISAILQSDRIRRFFFFFKSKLQNLFLTAKKILDKIKIFVIDWTEKYKLASNQDRWKIIRKPLFIFILLLFIGRFGYLFLPPKIDYSFPGDQSSEIQLDARVEVIFDRGVLKSLAEKSFNIIPKIQGKFLWESDRKLVFLPRDNFQRAASYKVNFQGVVLSKYFIPLVGKKSFAFDTVGNPKVILAAPQTEAPEDFTPITVVFDRPIIALTTATDSATKKPAFTLQPEVEGSGRWLGTTTYQFRPSERFKRASTYKVTVPGGLYSQDKGVLKKDYSWEFSSERPRIQEVSPRSNYDFVSPTASVSATFNQDINPESVKDNFSLYDKFNRKIPGHISVSGKVAGFYSAEPLKREERYKAVFSRGVQSTEGPNGMETDFTWFFKTAAKPGVIRSVPENNAKDIKELYSINVYFKTPMDEESFEGNIFIDPAPEKEPSFYFGSYEDEHNLSIGTFLARSEKYTITIGADVKDQYGIPLGSSYSFTFTTSAYKPSVNIYPSGTYFGAFNQEVVPRVVAQVINANKIEYSLYKLKREDLFDLYRRHYGQICNHDENCYNWQNYNPTKLEKVHSWSEIYEGDFNVPVHVISKITTKSGDKIPPGFYFLDLRIPQGAHDNMVMIVSKSALTVKKSDKQIFTWAVSQSTGEVIPGMKIQLTDSNGNIINEGTSNNDGVFMKEADLFQKENLFVFGQKDDDLVVAASVWNQGINAYDFGLPSHYSTHENVDYNVKQEYKLYLTLDRSIYRPGQKVYFKGVIRKDNDGAYANLQPGETVKVNINDSQNRVVYSQGLPITTYGSFSGEFTLSKEANLGYYQLGSSFQSHSYSQQFQVEEYRRPEVAVNVNTNKDAYTQGDKANVGINAAYYFGSPVTDAPVTWVLQTQDYTFRWEKDWRFEFGDPDSDWSRYWSYYSANSKYFSGEKVTEGKGKTDLKGDLEFILPLDIAKKKTSQKMIVEATVNDINNQSIAASREFTVHKGVLYVGLRPVSYSNQSGKEVKIELVTVDLKGNEVPDVPVAVEIYKRTWETVREQNSDDGLFYYTSKSSDFPVSTTNVTTDSLGRATATFTPAEGGTFKVIGKVSDKNGNQNVASSFVWVSGFGFSAERENNDRIVLITDKHDYLTGEDVSVFVASPYASDSAKTLLTVERGSVMDYKIVNTSETANNFSLSVLPKFSPNAFIGAVLVRGGNQVKKPAEFKIGYTEIKVTDKKQQIDVRINPDKKKYKPKEILKATIETKDLLGHPIPTELAVGLVDKAVWDLSSVELPDIYQTFYQPRNLGVSTSQLLTISLDRINANTNLGSKGGSGGGGGEGGNNTSRSNFPDTAYWNPSLKTGEDGKVEVNIALPDNLTTWRLTAIANTEGSAFGSKTSDVTVNRDILIRPFLPRFLSVGDEAILGAIIVNTSGEEQTLSVKIESQGLRINEDKTKQLVLTDGAQAKVSWATTAENIASAKIKLTVEGVNKIVKDMVELTLPVKSYSVPETVATSGQANDTASEKIVLPKELDRKQGAANINFSPSLGGDSLNAFSYLVTYPYGCIEQITSKFIPAVFIHRILLNAKIDLGGILDKKYLSNLINDGVQRLNNLQNQDGGWGWWMGLRSSPFISAYAYLALSEAKNDNFTVAEQTLQRAKIYLENQLSSGSDQITPDLQAYILYVLRGKKGNLSSYAASLFDRRFELSLKGRAYLAMASKDIPGMPQRAKRIHDELISLAKKTATTTFWEEAKSDYNFFGSNTTTTATILEVISLFDKKNPLIPEIVRYLMSVRNDRHWQSTVDTAAAIKAISSQILVKEDQKIDENYRLELNGKLLKEGKFTKEDLLKFVEYPIPITDFNIGGKSDLKISKSGEGNLYYNINLKYYLPFSEIKALEQGMVVVREFVDSQGKILPSDTVNENSEFWVRLILVAPEDRHFVALEDFLPAGLESVNESLKNVSVLNKEKPDLKKKGNEFFYFNHKEYHDDRTSLFAEYLPAGVYEVSYRVRATTPGRYHHPPAQAYQMYIPDVSGHSEGGWLLVK